VAFFFSAFAVRYNVRPLCRLGLKDHPAAFFVIFPVYFVVLWLLVSALISFVGGWRSLAKRFRLRGSFEGERWRWQSGQMRWLVGYHNCLTLGANEEGILLAIMFLLRFRHPSLLIPWNEVSVKRKRLWIIGEYVGLILGRETAVPLWIRASLAAKLRRAAVRHWPVEPVG
jgi:hypothetical protein